MSIKLLLKNQTAKQFSKEAYVAQRRSKAIKIRNVIEDYLGTEIKNMSILDVGCGPGNIAEYLAMAGNYVTGCDIGDGYFSKDVGSDFYKYVEIEDYHLPFENASFDCVVYNHVIEHLPSKAEQLLQLREIHRILKDTGLCYFACPNLLFPYDNHGRVWFLHYLPDNVYKKILNRINKRDVKTKKYETVFIRSWFAIRKLIKAAGFSSEEYTMKILNNMSYFSIDRETVRQTDRHIRKLLPSFLRIVSPTVVFVLSKKTI